MAEKKAQQLPTLTDTLIPTVPLDPSTITLELDEIWSFVRKKVNRHWVWLALCRKTRQIVAFVIGDRGELSCRKLWRAIPSIYRRGRCYTDFWQAYQAVIQKKTIKLSGKKRERPHMWSVLTTRCVNGWHVSCARPSHSQSHR